MKMRVFLTLALAVSSCLMGCTTVRHNTPPGQRLLEAGPGVGGPGPGVIAPDMGPAGPAGPAGVVGAQYCGPTDGGVMMAGGGAGNSVQVLFNRPEGMEIRYDVVGDGSFGSEALYVPGRQEFSAGGIYRLKLTNIQGPGREGVELYPTLEIAGGSARTAAYLAHNAIPVQFTPDDFEQVMTGNFVTKVIYLPDPEFQGTALVGVNVLVSNRLSPGLDPIVEADRRGTILAIIRIGNKDVEMAGVNASGGVAGMGMMPPMMGPMPPGFVSGVTAPQYGMTSSGTPIGLVGPPHIPLGTPAGLTKHSIRNTTRRNIPDPVSHLRVNVRQNPGQSYPAPVRNVRIREQNIHPGVPTGIPSYRRGSTSVTGASGEYCPPE
ncbi:MAG: hypothetical protein AAF483_02855 [Planctomycetota bacterium]